jgi:hypothetical protein
MSHTILALAIQAALWYPLGPWAGFAAASLTFFMREVTQAEYRWIEANGGLRAPMPWWKGLDVRLWDWHSRTDVINPMAATACVAWLSELIPT